MHKQTVMITFIIPSIQAEMDVEASLLLKVDELYRIITAWAEEKSEARFLADGLHVLVRKRNQKCFTGTKTLGEMGVENNEIFYLF